MAEAVSQLHSMLGNKQSVPQNSLEALSAFPRFFGESIQFAGKSIETYLAIVEKANQSLHFEHAGDSFRQAGTAASKAEQDIQRFSDTANRAANRVSGGFGWMEKSGEVSPDRVHFPDGSGSGNAAGTFFNTAITDTATGATLWGAFKELKVIQSLFGAATSAAVPFGSALVVSAAAGILHGLTKISEQSDEKKEAFQARVSGLYEDIQKNELDGLNSGIEIASRRSLYQDHITKQIGTPEDAKSYLDDLTRISHETPFANEDLAEMSIRLLDYGYQKEDLLPQIIRIGDLGVGKGLSLDEMNSIMDTIGQIHSSSQVSIDSLAALQSYGIPAAEYLADYYEKDPDQILTMVQNGKISGTEAADAISLSMAGPFSGAMDKLPKSYGSLSDSIQKYEQEIQDAMGDGFIDVMVPQLEKENKWYQENSGKLIEDAYLTGSLYGEQEATKIQTMMDTYDALWNGNSSFLNSENDQDGLLRYQVQTQNEAYIAVKDEIRELDAQLEASVGTDNYEELHRKRLEKVFELQSLLQSRQGMAENLVLLTDVAKFKNQSGYDTVSSIQENTAADKEFYMPKFSPQKALSGTLDHANSRVWLNRYNHTNEIAGIDYNHFFSNTKEPAQELNFSDNKLFPNFMPVGPMVQQRILQNQTPFPSMMPIGPVVDFHLLTDAFQTQEQYRYGNRWTNIPENKVPSSNKPQDVKIEVNVTGNPITIREESDISKIARFIADELRRAQQVS